MSTIRAAISQFAQTSTTWERAAHSLPHEMHILSTLLLPFLNTPVDPEQTAQIEIEKMHAIETFEILVQTWRAATPEVSP